MNIHDWTSRMKGLHTTLIDRTSRIKVLDVAASEKAMMTQPSGLLRIFLPHMPDLIRLNRLRLISGGDISVPVNVPTQSALSATRLIYAWCPQPKSNSMSKHLPTLMGYHRSNFLQCLNLDPLQKKVIISFVSSSSDGDVNEPHLLPT